ncbi:thiamine phosphate synthase, partial [bacterium]|nr:thiamine phosphate synthase [bacterium]
IPNLEANRTDIVSLAEANCRRVEESLRVLEEFLKLTDVTVIKEVKELRFTIYELEKHLKHELTQQ